MLYFGLDRGSPLVASIESIAKSSRQPDGAVAAHLVPLVGLVGPVDGYLPAIASSEFWAEYFRRVGVLEGRFGLVSGPWQVDGVGVGLLA